MLDLNSLGQLLLSDLAEIDRGSDYLDLSGIIAGLLTLLFFNQEYGTNAGFHHVTKNPGKTDDGDSKNGFHVVRKQRLVGGIGLLQMVESFGKAGVIQIVRKFWVEPV